MPTAPLADNADIRSLVQGSARSLHTDFTETASTLVSSYVHSAHHSDRVGPSVSEPGRPEYDQREIARMAGNANAYVFGDNQSLMSLMYIENVSSADLPQAVLQPRVALRPNPQSGGPSTSRLTAEAIHRVQQNVRNRGP